MKKSYIKLATMLIISLAYLQISTSVFAQSPQKMSYQAVIRDANNNLITNHAVGMRISILQSSATGISVYIETQSPVTNANGLASFEIGAGTIVSGSFSTINWANGPYFIKTETDPTGGIAYTIVGTSQLLSVPYALYAANAPAGPTGATGATGPAGANGTNGTNGSPGAVGATGAAGSANINGTANYLVKFTNATTGANSQLFDNGTNVGIGTTTPAKSLDVAGIGGIKISRTENSSTNNELFFSDNGQISSLDSSHRIIFNRSSDQLIFAEKGSFLFKTGISPGTEVMRILSNGNVGIGTNAPAKPLVVASSGGIQINRLENANQSNEIFFTDNGQIRSLDSSHRIIFNRSGNQMIFSEFGSFLFKTGTSPGTEVMRIQTNGNVGIGTTTPTKPLDIAASGGIKISRTENANQNNELFFGDNGQIRSLDSNHRIIFNRSSDQLIFLENGSFSFKTGASPGTEKVTILSNGNMGVGTTAPVTKLEVNGSIRQQYYSSPQVSVSALSSSNWTWTHNLGYQPVIILVKDQTNGFNMDYMEVSYENIDNNNTIIHMANRHTTAAAIGTIRWIVVY
ncbi:MAG: hypothetical protein WCL14_14840 [Bacteroidota bacterium]